MVKEPVVLQVIPALRRYGAERLAIELAAGLPSRGFASRMLVLFDASDSDGAIEFREELRDRQVSCEQLLPGPRSRWVLMTALRKRLSGDAELASGVVHTHLFGPDFWTTLVQLERRARRPRRVSTAHNVDQDDGMVRGMARRWTAQRMDRVVAVSNVVADYVQGALGVDRARVLTIFGGIDMARVETRRNAGFSDPARLLMVGRLEEQKGQEVALRALARVQAPWRLEVVGTGARVGDLESLVQELGIGPRVRFLGYRDDVPALLKEADLFLFPSRWEGLGLSLVEALAAGVPCLASDLSVLRGLLPPDRLLPPGDVAAWSRGILGVLERPKESLDQAQRLATTVRQRYAIGGMIDAYAELYRGLLP